MKLIHDWRAVLRNAFSLRFIELAALAEIAMEFVPFVSDFLPWWLPIALLALAWGGRLIKQNGGNDADK